MAGYSQLLPSTKAGATGVGAGAEPLVVQEAVAGMVGVMVAGAMGMIRATVAGVLGEGKGTRVQRDSCRVPEGAQQTTEEAEAAGSWHHGYHPRHIA